MSPWGMQHTCWLGAAPKMTSRAEGRSGAFHWRSLASRPGPGFSVVEQTAIGCFLWYQIGRVPHNLCRIHAHNTSAKSNMGL